MLPAATAIFHSVTDLAQHASAIIADITSQMCPAPTRQTPGRAQSALCQNSQQLEPGGLQVSVGIPDQSSFLSQSVSSNAEEVKDKVIEVRDKSPVLA